MRRKGFARGALLVSLAACGLGAALLLGRGVALADTVTGTTGDISYSVTWTQGAGTTQTTLVVTNTAAPGGHTISDFLFAIAGGPEVTSVSGGGCSTEDLSMTPLPAGEIECGNPLSPGQSETITIGTYSPVATGTQGTITFNDENEASQPAVAVLLQGSGGGTTGSTTTGTTSATTTGSAASADVAVSDPLTGILFYHREDLDLGGYLYLFFGAEADSAGFTGKRDWRDGETVYILLTVTNHGPDTARIRPTLSSSNGSDSISGLGVYNGATGGDEVAPFGTVPFSLAAPMRDEVMFRVLLHGAGAHVFIASEKSSLPDPVPANNSTTFTVDAMPRPDFTAKWDAGSQSLVGTQRAPSRGSSAVGSWSAASLKPVEVAILPSLKAKPVWRKANGTAQWSLHLGRVAPGSVIVLVRNVAPAKQAALEFSPKLHNEFKLRIG